MSFAATDYIRVLKNLQLPISQRGNVQTLLIGAEADAGLEDAIKDNLDALDTLQSAIAAERSNANSALTKADVLEWQPGKRSEGMEMQRLELQLELANLLGLDWSNSRLNYSGVTEIEVWHG